MRKRVLIITYYWPPAGGPGVQRWLKFITYLSDFGIEPVVLIPENPEYPLIDEAILEEVPENIKIHTVPIWEPYRLASVFSKKDTKRISSGIIQEKDPSATEKLLLAIRGNLFIPDARKFWIKPVVKYVKDLFHKESFDALITTGPPHSLHLIGQKIKQETGIHWIADFRDPWTNIGYHNKLRLSPSSQKKHLALEKSILQSADEILTTSKTTANEFALKTNRPIFTITNGFDHNRLKDISLDTKFSLAHIGSLLSERNPIVLWEALADLCRENETFSNDLELQFSGVTSADVMTSLKQYKLSEKVISLGYVSHQKAIQLQHSSQVLLLLEIDRAETKGIIPGKLFEYLVSGRPILAIGPEEWEVAPIVEETNSGKVFSPTEKEAIKKVVLDWHQQYKKGVLFPQTKDIKRYSRKALTQSLANIIHGNRI